MPANYPASIPDNAATGVGTTDNTTATPNAHAGFHDQLGLEIVAIGTDLVAARGASISLDAKIDAMDTDAAAKLVKASNLSDLADASTARTNLGLGSLATQSGTFSGTSSGTNTGDQTNISGNAATVTTNANLTGPVTSMGNATAVADGALSIAKTSGLQAAIDAKAAKASNLSDLADAPTARTNLGLGSLATQSGTFSGTSSGTNTGDQTNISGNAATVTTNANLTGDVTSVGNATTIGASKVTSSMIVDATIVGGDLSATIVIPTGATATTQSGNDNSTKLATTKYVNEDRDGWFATSDTWVYASATTFTIAGVNRTTQLTKGTRISYNDGAVDFGVVASVAFATNTTVTLIANSDYSIANTTLTAPRYSYAANPQGYPTWFGYTPTITGYSANPTATVYRFRVIGQECFLGIREGTAGTSNATTKTYSLPVAAITITNAFWGGMAGVVDNGITSTVMGALYVSSGGTTLSAFVNPSATSVWTATGSARITNANIIYHF